MDTVGGRWIDRFIEHYGILNHRIMVFLNNQFAQNISKLKSAKTVPESSFRYYILLQKHVRVDP